MNKKLQAYIQTLNTERITLINKSADLALTAIVQKHNGKLEEFEKLNLSCLVSFYQGQNLEVIIKDLTKIISEINVVTNPATSKVIDVGGI